MNIFYIVCYFNKDKEHCHEKYEVSSLPACGDNIAGGHLHSVHSREPLLSRVTQASISHTLDTTETTLRLDTIDNACALGIYTHLHTFPHSPPFLKELKRQQSFTSKY